MLFCLHDVTSEDPASFAVFVCLFVSLQILQPSQVPCGPSSGLLRISPFALAGPVSALYLQVPYLPYYLEVSVLWLLWWKAFASLHHYEDCPESSSCPTVPPPLHLPRVWQGFTPGMHSGDKILKCMVRSTDFRSRLLGSNPSSTTSFLILAKSLSFRCLYFLFCKTGIITVVGFKWVNTCKAL